MTEYQADQLRNIIEAALLVASRPMSLAQLEAVFEHDENPPGREQIRAAIGELQADYENRGIELVEVASGWRMQSRESMSPWIANLFQEKAPRYSRALLETLVLIAYRQPITRGEIEEVRGVAVSSNIVRTLIERDWVKIVGHRDVPGRPSLLGTTRQFLDYFNLRKIGELPTLSEIKALDEIAPELAQEVAMLDQTMAPDEEAAEVAAATSELVAGAEQENVHSADDEQAELDDSAEHASGEDDDVIISGPEVVDVDLSLAAETDMLESGEELEADEEREVLDQLGDESDETGAVLVADTVADSAATPDHADDTSADQGAVTENEAALADGSPIADESLEPEGVDVAVATAEAMQATTDEMKATTEAMEATIDAMSATPRPDTELLH